MPADRPAVEWLIYGGILKEKAHAYPVGRTWALCSDAPPADLCFAARSRDPRCPECERRVREESKP